MKDKYTLEFEYEYKYGNDEVSFSLSLPYTYSDLLIDTRQWMLMTNPKQLYPLVTPASSYRNCSVTPC
jgi:hypothetical protein